MKYFKRLHFKKYEKSYRFSYHSFSFYIVLIVLILIIHLGITHIISPKKDIIFIVTG